MIPLCKYLNPKIIQKLTITFKHYKTKHPKHKKMHASSIQTQYYDENDFAPTSNFYNHKDISQKKQMSPSGSGVALRIEENIKEYHEQIKKNKQTINQLECQRNFFEKLSLKQKEKIQQIDLGQIRSQYQRKILTVKQQVGELHQVITLLQQQQLQAEDSYLNTYNNIGSNKQFLMETLINMQKQNQSLENLVVNSENQLKNLELQIIENQKTIKEKQAIHRKYIELQIQIQRLQKICKLSPKKRS